MLGEACEVEARGNLEHEDILRMGMSPTSEAPGSSGHFLSKNSGFEGPKFGLSLSQNSGFEAIWVAGLSTNSGFEGAIERKFFEVPYISLKATI